MEIIFIVIQLCIIGIHIYLEKTKKEAWATEIGKSIIFFIRADYLAGALKLTDVIKEIYYKKDVRTRKLYTAVVPFIVTIITFAEVAFLYNNNKWYLLIAMGTLYTALKSWFTSKKSYFGHVLWMIFDIATGYYILALDEIIFIVRRCYTELKQLYVEELEKISNEKI